MPKSQANNMPDEAYLEAVNVNTANLRQAFSAFTHECQCSASKYSRSSLHFTSLGDTVAFVGFMTDLLRVTLS